MLKVEIFQRLYEVAEAQAGYLTTGQAEAAGVDRPRLSRYVATGRLQRVRWGVYRLVHFPRSRHEDLFIAWLETGPDSVISHESALALYDLSDALPAAIHLTVPRTASRRRHGLRLHTSQISPEEITSYEGLPVTTVPRTIADVAQAGLSPELVDHAVREAIARGLALPQELEAAAARCSKRARQLVRNALASAGQLQSGAVQL
jgi:predicted transcriptional regulator of viral defense system